MPFGQKAHNKLDIPVGELVARYAESKTAVSELAEKYGCSINTLYDRLAKAGISRRSNSDAHAGLQVGDKNPNYKGGFIDCAGYRAISQNNRQRRAHRVAMEEIIGRPLADDEVVHHINGDKSDNSPSNLMLMTDSEHRELHGVEKSKAYRALVESGLLGRAKGDKPLPCRCGSTPQFRKVSTYEYYFQCEDCGYSVNGRMTKSRWHATSLWNSFVLRPRDKDGKCPNNWDLVHAALKAVEGAHA